MIFKSSDIWTFLRSRCWTCWKPYFKARWHLHLAPTRDGTNCQHAATSVGKLKKSLACENIATHDSRLQFWYCGILWHLILLNSLVFTSIYNIFEYVWSSHRLWERRSVRIPEDWRMGRNGDNMWQPSCQCPGPGWSGWANCQAQSLHFDGQLLLALICAYFPRSSRSQGLQGSDWIGLESHLSSKFDNFHLCHKRMCIRAHEVGGGTWTLHVVKLRFAHIVKALSAWSLCCATLRYCTKFLFSLDVETFSAHIFASWSWVSC